MEGAEINPKVVQWFQEKRKISEKTLRQTKIYTEQRRLNGDETLKETIVFPSFWQGKVVNYKYRNAQKHFGQSPGGMKVFWNADALTDPRLQTDEAPLIITEGEIDCLTFLEIGCPAVSVPNGASFPKDPDKEPEYLTAARGLLEPIKRIILAVDNDKAGKPFAKYLAQRLGEARCFTVSYPAGCKDANDVLQKFGQEEVQRLVFEAKHYPVAGIYGYNELPAEPDLRPVTTGWGRLDEYLQLYHPSLVVLTGIPNAGKSKWVNQLCAQIATLHQWKIAIASFEGRTKYVTNTLQAVHTELRPRDDTYQWLNTHFKFILKDDDPDTDAFDIDWLLDKARVAVIRYGVKVVVIDPWNEVEHTLRKGETMTDYCGRALVQIKRFMREYDVIVIVVVHPTKSGGNKAQEDLNPYDIADSAHFFNKSDQCVIVTRLGESNEANVIVRKVREQPQTGKRGTVPFTFDPYTGTFSQ